MNELYTFDSLDETLEQGLILQASQDGEQTKLSVLMFHEGDAYHPYPHIQNTNSITSILSVRSYCLTSSLKYLNAVLAQHPLQMNSLSRVSPIQVLNQTHQIQTSSQAISRPTQAYSRRPIDNKILNDDWNLHFGQGAQSAHIAVFDNKHELLHSFWANTITQAYKQVRQREF